MTLLGHHVSRLFIVLVALDGALFFMTLQAVGGTYWCPACTFTSPLRLAPHELLLLTGAFLLITTSLGFYSNGGAQEYRTFSKRFIFGCGLVFVPVAGLVTLLVAHGPAFMLVLTLASMATIAFTLVLLGVHLALIWCCRLPFMKKRILVLGEGWSADAIAEFVNGHGPGSCQVAALGAGSSTQTTQLSVAVVDHQPAPLSAVAQAFHAAEIVVAVDERRDLPVAELLECKLKGIEVIDASTFWEREAGRIEPAQIGTNWLIFSGGFSLDARRRFIKRAFDLTLGATFLVAILPLALMVALLIKLDSPGPVFYRQERVGLNGRCFKLWKFRSMRVDAERDGVPRWAASADDRVTRLGRFIRKARIDEIPQVINVLAGDMSFIGPRPERPFFVDQLRKQIPHYDLRQRVRPGITGWSQVNYPYGASIEDAKRKLSYDLYYLKHQDLLLDLAILIQTVRVVLFADGAR